MAQALMAQAYTVWAIALDALLSKGCFLDATFYSLLFGLWSLRLFVFGLCALRLCYLLTTIGMFCLWCALRFILGFDIF